MNRDAQEIAATAASALLGRLKQAPWRFGFLPLLRRLSALWLHAPPIGQASRPQQEPVRLGQAASLAFAPREIAEVALPQDAAAERLPGQPRARAGNSAHHPTVRVYGLGMLGPNGSLPLHFTEMVRERAENHLDPTLGDFLDLFHHRYLTLMYRAWAQSQATAGLDRREHERFSGYVASLGGHDVIEIRDGPLPDHARLSASVHLAGEARHPDGLAATLARFFGVQVQVEEFAMHWIRIDADDRTQLGAARTSSILGNGAIAGEFVPDRQSKFRLVLGPLSLPQYLRFTPQGADLPVLVEWVRAFVGHEFAWEVELRVRRDNAPAARVDEQQKLGWSTWLGTGSAAQGALAYTVGLQFEPEDYLCAGHTYEPAVPSAIPAGPTVSRAHQGTP